MNNSPLSLFHIIRTKMSLFKVFGIDFTIVIDIISRCYQFRDQVGSHYLTILGDFGPITWRQWLQCIFATSLKLCVNDKAWKETYNQFDLGVFWKSWPSKALCERYFWHWGTFFSNSKNFLFWWCCLNIFRIKKLIIYVSNQTFRRM